MIQGLMEDGGNKIRDTLGENAKRMNDLIKKIESTLQNETQNLEILVEKLMDKGILNEQDKAVLESKGILLEQNIQKTQVFEKQQEQENNLDEKDEGER